MLKGKTIIELTDVNTGEKEVIEENNMVTNAINDLFNTLPNLLNPYVLYNGSAWFMSGFQRLYEFLLGGILLFDGQIEEKAENTFAPADVNLVGCGVYNHKNSSTKNKVRGDYNGVESEFNEEQKYMKFVYDFSTSQANGTIASVCLTSYYGGCTSYGSKEAEFIKNSSGTRSEGSYNFCKHVFHHLSNTNSSELLVNNTIPRCFSGDINYKRAVTDKNYSVILTPSQIRSDKISAGIYDKEHPIFIDIDEDAVYYLKTKHETTFESYWIVKRKAYLKSVSILDVPMAKGELIEEVEVISDISFANHNYYAGKCYCYDVAKQCLYIFVGNGEQDNLSYASANSNINLIKVDLSNGLTNAKGQEITVKNTTGVELDIVGHSRPFISNGFLYVNKNLSNITSIRPEIYKIEIANPANVKKLKDETIPNNNSNGVGVWYDGTDKHRPIYEHCGTIYMGNGYIIRNDEVLRTELSYFYYDVNYSLLNANIIPVLKNKKSSPFIYISYDREPANSCSENYLYLYALNDAFCYLFNYLATINNLAEPVTKTADKTMKITYIIQETEPEESVP